MSHGGSIHADIRAVEASQGLNNPNGSAAPADTRTSTSELGLTCSTCRRTFRRPENLKRHAASHMKERRFPCSHPGCDKKFYRSDALQRHETIHQSVGKSKGIRSSIACLSCANARVKCTGETQCARCRSRSIECLYRRRRGTSHQPGEHHETESTAPDGQQQISQAMTDGPHFEQAHVEDSDGTSGWSRDHPALREETYAPLNGFHPMVPVRPVEAPSAIQDSDAIDAISPVRGVSIPVSHRSESFAQNVSSNLPPENRPPSYQNPPLAANFPNESMNESSMTGFDALGVINGQDQQALAPPSVIANLSNVERIPMDHSYAAEYFGPSMLSTLNWLPTDYSFPGADADMYGMELSPQLVPGLPIEAQALLFPFQDNNETSEPVAMTPQYEGSQNSYRSPSQSTQGHHASPLATSSRLSGSDAQQGGYYVDGDGARLPRNGRRRKAKIPMTEDSPFTRSSQGEATSRSGTTFAFPEMAYPEVGERSHLLPNGRQINDGIYHAIAQCFHQTCIMSPVYSPFDSTNFPTLQAFDRLIELYLQFFHPLFPFLHLPSLELGGAHWLLPLALAAVGSHYLETEGSDFATVAMHEFLRRAISITIEKKGSRNEELVFAQASFLNCIGMFYTGFDGFTKAAPICHNNLVNYWGQDTPKPTVSSGNIDDDWNNWRQYEACVRIRSSVWLLDTMLSYHFDSHPRLPWEIEVLLPCDEPAWEAQEATTWQELPGSSPSNHYLHDVLQILYMEKRIPSQIGEFAKIHLIYGLYRQLWDIGHSLRRPLSRWTPIAERIDSSTLTNDIWLPRDPKYKQWRNASCDVIDVLHWRANSIIATSGTENPTVNHLHFARIILLTPYQHILDLALFMSGETPSRTAEQVRHDRQRVRQWATEDQHKARLAMIHAGVGFWHVRRYSTGGFYEPSNVFFSTIAVWAYGSFSQLLANNSQQSRRESSQSSSDSFAPTSIRLDRPTDDELVQLYVKNGASMKATITGVGNISGPRGPHRVLKEGCKILRELTNWGIGARYIRILTRLADKYAASP